MEIITKPIVVITDKNHIVGHSAPKKLYPQASMKSIINWYKHIARMPTDVIPAIDLLVNFIRR